MVSPFEFAEGFFAVITRENFVLLSHVVLSLGVLVKYLFAEAAAHFCGPAPMLGFDVRIDARPG